MARDLLPYIDDVVRIFTRATIRGSVIAEHKFVVLDNHMGRLSISFEYSDASRFHLRLLVDCSGDEVVWDLYGFQYLDAQGRLLFRYDNAPHHYHLPNFPHHLHLATGEIRPEGPPRLHDVARAIRWHLDHPGEVWRPALSSQAP